MSSPYAYDSTSNLWKPANVTPPQRLDSGDSPVALYHFDGDLTDSSGNGHDLTVASGVERWSDMWPDFTGFQLGSTRLVNSDPALLLAGDMSLLMLARINNISTVGVTTFWVTFEGSGETEATNAQYSLYFQDQKTGTYHEHGSGVNDAHDIPDRPGNFVVCTLGVTRTSDVYQLYLNGRPFGDPSAALTPPSGGTSSFLNIGALPNNSLWADGVISGLGIYGSSIGPTRMLEKSVAALGGIAGVP